MKALLHFVPRSGSPESFDAEIAAAVRELARRPAAAGLTLTCMTRLADDPLGPNTPYRASLEIKGDADTETFTELLDGFGPRCAGAVATAESTVLLGYDLVFKASPPLPVRYQSLMRRRSDFDHARYLARYRDIHSDFGIRMPGIAGYAQFHVDPEASRVVSSKSGFGVWDVDSVSQLQLESLATFLAAIPTSTVPQAAMADEKLFVDRANSFDFISSVEFGTAGPRDAAAASGGTDRG